MSFPSYQDWVRDVLNPRDRIGGTSPWCFETEAWHQAYFNKYRIAAVIRPRSILEIGVRYGYAAHAFLQACTDGVRYHGIDLDSPEVNAMGEPTCDQAFEMLARTASCEQTRVLTRADTQAKGFVVPPWLHEGYDLVHIDACHTFDGATADIMSAWPLTRCAMLVDDYIGSPPVHDAVDAFVAQSGALLLQTPSGTGEALLLK